MRAADRARGLGLALLLLGTGASQARDRTGAVVRAWVSEVIDIIDGAVQKQAFPGRGRTVTVRVQVAADGFVNRVAVERSSGSADLDQRATALIRAAGPFRPPPAPLLTRAGTTDLSFPVRLGR